MMAVGLALLAGAAGAAEVSVGVAPSWILGDPLVVRSGATLALEAGPDPLFAVALTGGFYPALGESDYTPLASHLIQDAGLGPALSRLIGSADLRCVVYPFTSASGPNTARAGVYGGFGAAWTVDDLQALRADADDPVYVSTATEVHSTLLYGLRGQYRRGKVSAALDLGTLRYVEAVGGTYLARKDLWTFSLGLTLHIPPTR